MSAKNNVNASFRVGRVTVYLRGRTWYLRYHEAGRRRQVRATTDRKASRQLAAQVNAQLEAQTPAATSFEPIGLPDLRRAWLDHHEYVLRSAVSTIDRYRSATEHLLNFVRDQQPMRVVAQFRPAHAEAFTRYLRQLEVAPNGHPNTAKRRLRDKGVKFALEVSRSLFTFAIKRRHLPPYTENPFTVIQVERVPVEDAKPVTLLNAEQEVSFLEACDDWQFPVFTTLILTGLRPGELTHLLAEDVDLEAGWLWVRNKPDLGWRVKTRSERRVPLVPELRELLARRLDGRVTGPLFLRRRCADGDGSGGGTTIPPLARLPRAALAERLRNLIADRHRGGGGDDDAPNATGATSGTRRQHRVAARWLWVMLGAVPETRLRNEFMRLTRLVGLPDVTAPKTLRHLFATWLQAANVDPLIRNQLMGHAPPIDGRGPLGMTAVYSHAGPETVRRQLEDALRVRPALDVVSQQLRRVGSCVGAGSNGDGKGGDVNVRR
jgi:integrase